MTQSRQGFVQGFVLCGLASLREINLNLAVARKALGRVDIR